MALSRKQRLAIHDRDSINDVPSCMFPHRPGQVCGGRLEVHHIRPQRWLYSQGVDLAIVDHPSNLITVCQNSHTQLIHPDMHRAKLRYAETRDSFKEAFALRDQLVELGIPYWNTEYDTELKIIASHRTRIARLRGWLMPVKQVRQPIAKAS